MRNRAFCEKLNGRIVRIFRTTRAAMNSKAWDEDRVVEYPRSDAVADIRRQVFERANGECQRCGRTLTWGMMHMHETTNRGQGGEISIDNCEALCFDCHEGPDGAHGNRLPKFTKKEPIRV